MTKSILDLEMLLTPKEVAEVFRVSPRTVGRWEAKGHLTVVMTAGGQRRYPISSVRKLLKWGTEKARL